MYLNPCALTSCVPVSLTRQPRNFNYIDACWISTMYTENESSASRSNIFKKTKACLKMTLSATVLRRNYYSSLSRNWNLSKLCLPQRDLLKAMPRYLEVLSIEIDIGEIESIFTWDTSNSKHHGKDFIMALFERDYAD